MTIDELRTVLAPLAADLERRADFVESDDFAPWVTGAIRDAAKLLRVLDDRVPTRSVTNV